MSKKVLILSSSPRKKGNSNALCDRFMEGAGNYVLLYGGPRDIYVHYDRSQNNLPIRSCGVRAQPRSQNRNSQ